MRVANRGRGAARSIRYSEPENRCVGQREFPAASSAHAGSAAGAHNGRRPPTGRGRRPAACRRRGEAAVPWRLGRVQLIGHLGIARAAPVADEFGADRLPVVADPAAFEPVGQGNDPEARVALALAALDADTPPKPISSDREPGRARMMRHYENKGGTKTRLLFRDPHAFLMTVMPRRARCRLIAEGAS